MIYKGTSLVGQYHLDSGSDVCQDSNHIAVIDEDIIVAVVADGVGSESHSEIASRIAAEESAEYCKKFYADFVNKLDLLNNSFQKALFAIEDESQASGIPMNQLDCTLCTVIFDHGKVYVGNIGDSGAIGLRDDGRYISLSRQQNDEEGRVYPLAFRSSWEFTEIPGHYVSVLLATDGFFNYLHPVYLRKSKSYMEDELDTHIDYLRIREYIDTLTVGSMSQDGFGTHIDDLVSRIPRIGGPDGTNDDLTVVCIVTDEPHGVWQDYEPPFNRDELRVEYKKYLQQALYPNITKPSEVKGPSYQEMGQVTIGERPQLDEAVRGKLLNNVSDLLASEGKPLRIVDITIDDVRGEIHKAHSFDFQTLAVYLGRPTSNPRMLQLISRNIVGAVKIAHEAGYSVGILSPESILVNNKGEVLLGDPEYFTKQDENIVITNPQSDSNFYSSRTILSVTRGSDKPSIVQFGSPGESVKSDIFSMATVLFKTLSDGTHPFSLDSDSIIENIMDESCILDDKRFDRRFLTSDLEMMFDDSFHGSDPPDARNWEEVLDRYSTSMEVCGNNPNHLYPDKFRYCPYCATQPPGNNRIRLNKEVFGLIKDGFRGIRSSCDKILDALGPDTHMLRQGPEELDTQKEPETSKTVPVDGFKDFVHGSVQTGNSEDKKTISVFGKDRDDFIKALINRRPPRNVIKFCQWPVSYSEVDGKLVWKTEKKEYETTLEEMYRNLNDVPISRRAKIAYNLSAMVAEFEKLGYGVGNIEPANVGITGSGGVIFLIGDPLSMSYGDLQPIETDAPMDKRFVRPDSSRGDRMVFSKEDGDYMLAQHISWLLFGNSTHTNPNEAGLFHVEPDMNLQEWFPKYLVDGFINVIEARFIPTGMDWKNVMERYSVDVQRCDRNRNHVYYTKSPECPYCKTFVDSSDYTEDTRR